MLIGPPVSQDAVRLQGFLARNAYPYRVVDPAEDRDAEGAAVVSHWFLDVVVHVADLPLAGNDSPKLGLGLWRHLGLSVALATGPKWRNSPSIRLCFSSHTRAVLSARTLSLSVPISIVLPTLPTSVTTFNAVSVLGSNLSVPSTRSQSRRSE